MSEAKKCDQCESLYEAKADDDKVIVREIIPGYGGSSKIIGFLRLFKVHGFHSDMSEPMDHCQECTEKAVRRFMLKFVILERKGQSFQCRIRTNGRGVFFEEGPALSKEDNIAAREKNLDFFAGFSGKRVRITVEVL